jgi:hypothetical protein
VEPDSAPHTVTLKQNSTLVNYTSLFARVVVVGNNVHVENVELAYPMYVKGEEAINISLKNVTCTKCVAAVVVTGAATTRHGAVPVDISLESIGGSTYAAALAHTTGRVNCTDATAKIVLQPVGSAITTAAGCNATDLGALLSLYGDSYILNFFDGPPHKIGPLVFAAKIMTVITASILVVAYLSAYHLWQKIKDERKLHQA